MIPSNISTTTMRISPAVKPELLSFPKESVAIEVKMAVLDMKRLRQKAFSYDAVAEIHHVTYEASRSRGVHDDALRWCLEAGVQKQDVLSRHENHACYFCEAPVRLNGVIFHTFWQCLKRMDRDEEITRKLRQQDRVAGATEERNGAQKRGQGRRKDVTTQIAMQTRIRRSCGDLPATGATPPGTLGTPRRNNAPADGTNREARFQPDSLFRTGPTTPVAARATTTPNSSDVHTTTVTTGRTRNRAKGPLLTAKCGLVPTNHCRAKARATVLAKTRTDLTAETPRGVPRRIAPNRNMPLGPVPATLQHGPLPRDRTGRVTVRATLHAGNDLRKTAAA